MATEYRSTTGQRTETEPKQGELLITREFDAPISLVWQTWTDPKRAMRWWGPKGYTSPYCKIDLRVGGKNLSCMRSPEGNDIWSTGVFREIIPMKRIVTTDSFADENGNVVPASYYGMDPNFPLEMLVTVTFTDLGDKTRLTLRHASFPTDKDCEDAQSGWRESLDKFADVLKS